MSTLYEIINVLPLSLLSVMIFGGYAGIPTKSILAYSVCLLFTVWIIILRHMKTKNRLRSIGIVAVFLVGLSLAAGEEYRQAFFEEHFFLLWVICFGAGAVIAGILMNRNVWIKRLVSAALFAYCITAAVLDMTISKETFSLICFILLIRAAEEIQRRWKKSGSPDMKDHITRISPFFLVACLTVYFVPAPKNPYGWQFAKNIYYSTVSQFNRIYGYFAHTSDDYGNIGFSDNNGFLSGINSNEEQVLIIQADSNKIEDLKLVGCISSDFTGREWKFDTESENAFRLIDTMETSAAVMKYSSTSRSDLLQYVNLRYETLFYNTKYIFSPAKIRLESTRAGNSDICERNGSIVSTKRLNYKDSYNVSCYVLNYNYPRLEEFIERSEPISEQDWERTAAAEGVEGKSGYSYEDYQNYRREVYEKYCRPCGVSEEVGKIVNEIAESSASRYEAMKKLEYFLHSMEYSTESGALPKSVTDAKSFLDHFLLRSRKGYCMHFATAFVLMANEMGVPSRYIQGYSVVKAPNGDIIVKQSDAHAWAEVYFDNVGWIAFEPTPGFTVSSGWIVTDGDKNYADMHKPEWEFTGEPTVPNDIIEDPEQEKNNISPLIFIIPSSSVITFLLAFYIIGRSIAKKKYLRMSLDEKYSYITHRNLRYLGMLGLGMNDDETLTEFTNRIKETERQDIIGFLGFIPIYETVLYSDKQITEDEIRAAEETSHELRILVKKSKLKYRLMLLIKNQ